jgi:hypothetical protein
MFIRNWWQWKKNIKRFFVLTAVNLALLFILGPYVFVDFIKALRYQIIYPYIWTGNHSIRSFVTLIANKLSTHGWSWANQYAGLVQLVLLAITVICLFIVLLQAYRQNQHGINAYLLLTCTIISLVIPSVSHDYKLSILGAPVAFLFSKKDIWEGNRNTNIHRILMWLLLFFSAIYSSTLFSFAYKPLLLRNNFPALVTLLFMVTFLAIVTKPGSEANVSASEII